MIVMNVSTQVDSNLEIIRYCQVIRKLCTLFYSLRCGAIFLSMSEAPMNRPHIPRSLHNRNDTIILVCWAGIIVRKLESIFASFYTHNNIGVRSPGRDGEYAATGRAGSCSISGGGRLQVGQMAL